MSGVGIGDVVYVRAEVLNVVGEDIEVMILGNVHKWITAEDTTHGLAEGKERLRAALHRLVDARHEVTRIIGAVQTSLELLE